MKYRMLALIWLTLLISYFDRVNLSLAAPVLSEDLGLSKGQLGLLFSAFFLGYTLMQIPGGYLGDRFGQKWIIVISMILWSFFTLLTGLVSGFVVLFVVRVLFGLSEAMQAPAAWKVLANWFKPGERARANSAYLTSLALGPAVAPAIVVPILTGLGWREVFYISAIPGVLVAFLIAYGLKNKPEVPVEEQPAAQQAPGAEVSAREVWRSPNLWFAFFAFFGFGFAFYGIISWLPTYLTEYKGFSLADMGVISTLPYAFGAVGLILGGQLGDRVFKRNRKHLVAMAFLATAASLSIAYLANTVFWAGVAFSVSGFFLYLGFGPFWTIPQAIFPDKYAGTFIGFINMATQIAGFIAPTLIGFLVGAGTSFLGGFVVMIAGLVGGAIVILQIRPDRSPEVVRKAGSTVTT